MKSIKIYRDKQNNKQSKAHRIRVVNADVPDARDAITIAFDSKIDADRVELFVHKVLQSIR